MSSVAVIVSGATSVAGKVSSRLSIGQAQVIVTPDTTSFIFRGWPLPILVSRVDVPVCNINPGTPPSDDYWGELEEALIWALREAPPRPFIP